MTIKGLIFDVDGTLADTIPICIKAFQNTVLRHLGRKISDQDVIALFGPTEDGMLEQHFGCKHPKAPDTYLYEYERLHRRVCSEPFVGIAELLQMLANSPLLLGVVTGKGAKSAELTCRILEIRKYFSVLAAGSPVGPIKPQNIESVLSFWELAATEVAYIGDSPSDVKDAKVAGVTAVAAAWASTVDRDALVAAKPDHLFDTVEELTNWTSQLR